MSQSTGDAALDIIAEMARAGPSTPLIPPPSRRLCVRHQRMADEPTTAKLQKSIESLPLADQQAVNTVWTLFSSSPASRRALILQGLLTMCCFSQLSLLSSELALAIRIDPFSLFPREISLKVLGYVDAMSLGRAAQVSRTWRALADDDLLWRNMCEQHIERKCEKCGWGLPLLSERRRRAKPSTPLTITPSGDAATGVPSPTNGNGTLKRSITAAKNAAAQERHARADSNAGSAAPSPSVQYASIDSEEAAAGSSSNAEAGSSSTRPSKRPRLTSEATSASAESAAAAAATALITPPHSAALSHATRPWKSVYCERLAIERNWRKGRYTSRVLRGHKDGIMCLQFSDHLAHPQFPVLITGSYDRTARVWNLDTGAELRVLRGHSRGVRCLQFDEAKLITGSMDRTLKIWNWRTGSCIRTLEGHTEGIICLNFNEDTLASGSADSNIKIWNFKNGECYTLRGHTDWVNSVLLWSGPASGGSHATKTNSAAGGAPTNWNDGELRADGERSTSAGASASAASFVFSASDDGTIRLWDLELRECLLNLDGHVAQVQSIKLVMLPHDVVDKLAQGEGGSDDQTTRRGSQHRIARQGENDRGANVSNSMDGVAGSVASSSSSSGASTCGYNASVVPGGREPNGGFAPAMPERHYNNVASRSASNSITRKPIDPQLARLHSRLHKAGLAPALPLDAEEGDIEKRRRGASTDASGHGAGGGTRAVLYSGSLDNCIKAWDIESGGKCVRTLFGHTLGVWAVDCDTRRLVSVSHDRTIKTWSASSGACELTLVGPRGATTCVQLADDKIVCAGDDTEIRVFDFSEH
ncbi:WD40 repeat-like protein [Ceraceosorus guamensis]|uniref:WD40 repeat-like protein n=1 Tax=Ceraceosorus guamensis TaxID=1522189 RepID=A0A316W4D2_9BASI|nr:WD40 repeat-like protein [Ceraceosorus guamensis]PWN44786.1 WD40 repeat-like protein [Ceraceosorus guamensis]